MPSHAEHELVRALEEKRLELERLNQELAEREARLRAIFDAEPECVKLLARDGALLEMNPAGLRMIEADSLAQVTGRSLTPLVSEEHREPFRALIDRVFQGESGSLEFEITGLKGGRRWLETLATPLRDAGGAIVALLGITRDITARRQAESALRDSEARYASVVTALAEGIVLQGRDGSILAANQSAERILGMSLDQMAGRTSLDPRWRAVHEDLSPFPGDTHPAMATLRTGRPVLGTIMGVHKPDGELTWISINSQPIVRPGDRQPSAVVASFTDITERRSADEALRRSEERFRELAETIEDVFWITDAVRKRVLYVSPAYEQIWRRSPEDLYRRPYTWLDAIHPDDRARVRLAARTRLTAGTYNEEYRIVRPDGEVRWIRDRAFPVRNASGEVERIVGVARDVHERRLAEDELQRREEQFRRLIEDAADMISVINRDGLFRFQSPSSESVLGYRPEEMLGRHVSEVIHPDDHAAVAAALDQAVSNPTRAVRVEYRVRHRDGQWRTLQTVGRSFPDQAADGFIVLNSRDITDSRLLEEQFRQSQKMEAVGQLAGGIAHDFNNLLTVINGTAELALGQLHAEDPLRIELTHIRDAGNRAAALTRQLLAFSRKQIMNPRVLDLNAVVADMQRMLQRLIGEHIEFVFNAADHLGSVRADPSQIEQVVMNLVVNARDAMAGGGVLTIETRNVELDPVFAADHPSVVPGPHVLLSVADTGSGMDEATTKRIFEPFFSTKGPGRGTGLGLPTVYGIVKQSGGSIWVSSKPGHGTTFTIYLPQVAAAPQRDRLQRAATPAGGTETILVVEDEPAVLDLASRFLQSAGYTVVTASNAAEALATAAGYAGPIHLILTDVVMPGMSGWELAAKLDRLRPSIKVLYASGYTDDPFFRDGGATDHFLAKPYALDELTRKVRAVLDSSTGSSSHG